MSAIKVTELKKYLSSRNEKELRDEIIELFKLFKNIKEFYSIKIQPDNENELMKKYKKIIVDEFFPDRGFGKLRYAVLKKAHSDLKKITKYPMNVAELMMTHVECGVDFTNEYSDIDEQFYDNIFRMYEEVIVYTHKQGIESNFALRCKKVMEESRRIGWGFGDDMRYRYYENFNLENDG